jgi:uncharacterized protein (TIGR00369 family)
MPAAPLKMTLAEVSAFVAALFPQSEGMVTLDHLEPGRVVCRRVVTSANLRPGGTVSGPTMMALADTAAYFLVLATIGPVELAVTSHLSIHFLRKPRLTDLIATADLLRLSKRQLVCTIELHSEGEPDPVAHVTATYAIPSSQPGDRRAELAAP